MRMIGPYEIGVPLARGGHAVVHLARDAGRHRESPQHAPVVAKVARRGDEAVLHHENACLRRVEHPNVIAPVAMVDDGLDAALVLPLAACSLGAMHSRLRAAEVLHVLRAIAGAIGALHEQGLVHRDIAPQNILLAHDTTPLLADLGRAGRADHDGVRHDVCSLARCGSALLRPDGDGPGDTALRALLDAVTDGRSPFVDAPDFATALDGIGIVPAAPDPHAVVPISVEPPTTAMV
jgi:serine/threonine protein kinase